VEFAELVHAGERVAYTLRRSERRTLALRIAADGAVRVSAPRRLPRATVEEFLRRHADWVLRKRRELALANGARAEPADGMLLPWLGAVLRLRVGAATGRSRAERRGDELHVRLAPGAALRAVIERWCRRAAAAHAAERIAHFAPRVGRAPRRVSIRAQRSRWGACSARDTVTLNWRLMQAPPGYLDYVIVHELCHLLHRDHSARFWRAVARVLPDYGEWRRGLRQVARGFVL
jgi:hypothetical protein